MHKTLRTGLVFFLIIPSLAVFSACAKKTTTVQKESKIEAETSEADRQKELEAEAERQRKEAEHRRFLSAKTQVMQEDIYFDFDRYNLTPAAQENLLMKAQWLRENPDATVTIEGHCDERGTNEYNLALGDRRADSAKGFLVNLGISASRLTTISYGEERPVCTQSTEECWAKNRRGNFVLN